LENYITALKLLVQRCNYKDPEEAVRDQLILNIKDEIAREKILDKA